MIRRIFIRRQMIFLTSFPVLFLLFSVLNASAQDFPARPIKIITPFAPGGVSGVIWHSMAESMSKVLGTPDVVENRPGGGTTLAYSLIASAKPDGYTVGHISFGFINTYLAYDVGYHPQKSYTYIGGVWRYNESVAVRSDAPWNTWDEFIDYSRKHPNEIRVGFSNPIGVNVAPVKWAAQKSDVQWKQVVFQSEAECITALLGKNIEAFPGAGVVHTLLRDGRAKMLSALTIDPIPGYPHIPTFKEVYGMTALNAGGLIGPAEIPEPIVKKLGTALQEGIKDPAFQKTLEKVGAIPRWRTSKDFYQDVESALSNSRQFLKDLGLLKANK
jgi:tripartite-type tricarboxylate transporter receptor subunit TctC